MRFFVIFWYFRTAVLIEMCQYWLLLKQFSLATTWCRSVSTNVFSKLGSTASWSSWILYQLVKIVGFSFCSWLQRSSKASLSTDCQCYDSWRSADDGFVLCWIPPFTSVALLLNVFIMSLANQLSQSRRLIMWWWISARTRTEREYWGWRVNSTHLEMRRTSLALIYESSGGGGGG